MSSPPRTKLVNVAEVRVVGRHRRDVGNVAALAASMADLGLLHPIVVDARLRLVAGGRRLAAAKALGWKTIRATVAANLADAARALRAERDENAQRKPLLPSEMVSIARALEPMEQDAAKQRKGVGKLPTHERGRAADRIANAVGTSRRNLENARTVIEAAERDPALQYLVVEMDRTGRVDPAYRKLVALKGQPFVEPTGQREVPLPFGARCIIRQHNYRKKDEAALVAPCVDDTRPTTVTGDRVMTPLPLAQAVAAAFKPSGVILEPCAGTGNFVQALEPFGRVFSCEIDRGEDFFAWTQQVDWIVTNPPWSKMSDFLVHAMQHAPHVVFLTAVNHYWTKSRVRAVRDAGFGYKELLLIDYHPEGFVEMGFQLGVMHVERGYKGPLAIGILPTPASSSSEMAAPQLVSS